MASQNKFDIPRKDSDKIRFELVNNLIVLPVEVNGIELSFLLDSGVSKPILFNITNTDSLLINSVETIYLRGLGGGESVKALKSRNNFFKIGNAINVNQDLYVVFDQSINFTPRLGIPIHGIIGFDVFDHFVVEINYRRKFLRLHEPNGYEYRNCKNCETFDLSFYNDKPYIEAKVGLNDLIVPVKLLIDSGSSDALWLFEDDALGISPRKNMEFDDFLGRGLSGNLYGKRSKIESFSLGRFKLEDVNVAFPDSTSVSFARKYEERNGSLCAEILKRFNLIMDYSNKTVTFKKNGNFKSEFRYDRSGIVLEQRGLRVVREKAQSISFDNYGRKNDENLTVRTFDSYEFKLRPAYQIVEIRKNSPAAKSGLLVNDIVITINGKPTHTMRLQEAMEYFQKDIGKTIKLNVDREKKYLKFQFELEDPFKPKELP